MQIRKLTVEDAAAFWSLRLAGLRDYPASFGEDYATAMELTAEQVRRRVVWATSGDNFIFGAFDPELVGTVCLLREEATKQRHKAEVWGVLVAPEAQGQGVASTLLQATITAARAVAGLDHLRLGVETNNAVAIRSYERAGFERLFTDPRTMKVDDRFVDEYIMVYWLAARGE